MDVRINHKGPGHPYKVVNLYDVMSAQVMSEPLVFYSQQEKDYVDALCLVTGKEIKTKLWGEIEIGSNEFFSFIFIPNL